MRLQAALLVSTLILVTPGWALAADDPSPGPARTFQAVDVFGLEQADSPAVAPDGKRIAYVRVSGDIQTDRFRRAIWMVESDGSNHRPVVQGSGSYSSPVWSPKGDALAFVATDKDVKEIRVLYLDSRQTAVLARVPAAPQNLTWSPDGATLAFQMHVDEKGPEPAALPPKPEGAQWAPAVKVEERLQFRSDGQGENPDGFTQLFVLPADGGTPRQLTFQARNVDGRLSFSPDGKRVVFSANLEPDWELDPVESSLYAMDLGTGALTRLTDRDGPEDAPIVSPDGRQIAFISFEDKRLGYQVHNLYVMDTAGGPLRNLTAELDRAVRTPQWTPDGAGIVFMYEDNGRNRVARVDVASGRLTPLMDGVTGGGLGRPYAGGGFHMGRGGTIAATWGDSNRPADLAVLAEGGPRLLTRLNDDLLAAKVIPKPTEIRVPSSFDGKPIHAWVVRPPDFDPAKKYPLLLEIHGGPFAAYGSRFAAEIQLYAAAGYVVVYANPRGSSSYGSAFGNEIHHAYPGHDYFDLMSVVDAVIAQGSVDPKRLFVTGGSGGGVLTAWIVGKTDRFAAAVTQKPVINWTSFALTADLPALFHKYWFPDYPWVAQADYWARSPLAYVGNVKTPTAVLCGEADLRTPISESEQYYTALRLRGVPTRLIRIPEAPHNVAFRPTGIINTAHNVLAWFAQHGGPPVPAPAGRGNGEPRS